ncbi:hypothetical protein, partial [Fischerella thermalis]|uniref:hypothetical protein n=1 Tax=Fischerella thermalis TaxID=372787 RepID=UPI000CB9851C
MDKFHDLFTYRQALALTTLVKLVKDVEKKLADSQDKGLADAVQTCLSLAIDKQTDKLSSLGRWQVSRENPQG